MQYRSKLVAWFNFRFDKSQFSVKKNSPTHGDIVPLWRFDIAPKSLSHPKASHRWGDRHKHHPFYSSRRSHLWDGGLVDQARPNMTNRFPMCSDLICGHQHNKKGSGSEHFLWGKLNEGGKTWFLIMSLGRGWCVWWTTAWFYHFSWHNIKDWPPEPDVRYQCVPLSC